MLHLAEIMYSEDKKDSIFYHQTIFRLVDDSPSDSFTMTLKEKVERWFNKTFQEGKFKLVNIEITEPIN